MIKIFNKYLQFCFEIDKILGEGNLIDSFSGDEKFNIVVDRDTIYKRLRDFINEINDTVEDTYPFFSKTYLIKHVNALILQLEINDNINKKSYLDTISILYDIEASIPDYNKIERLKKEIYKLLADLGIKGKDLNEKILLWKKQNEIESNEFISLVNEKKAYCSKLTFKLLKNRMLSADDISNVEDVLNIRITETEAGWAAYNYYLKNYTGTIEFNSQAKFLKSSIDTFVTHEAYPGHHTSCFIKELLSKKNIYPTYSAINLLNTPSSLIEEGIGDCGIDIIGVRQDSINNKIQYLLDELSSEAYYYAAYEFYANNKSESDIMKILINDKLHTDETDAKRAMQFIRNWGYYIPTYKFGKELVRELISDYSVDCLDILYAPCCMSTIEMWKKEYKYGQKDKRTNQK